MERNRWFKSTFGVGAEFVVAQSLDNSGVPVDGVAPTAATSTVTVAGTPTLGDRINFTVNGAIYSYIVKSTDTTAAILVASIVAYINQVQAQGIVASVTGTTSAVFSFAAPLGISFNSATNTLTLGAPNAATFSAASATNFGSNGVDPIPAGAQPTLTTFVANSANGALGVYWVDNQEAVLPGATSLYANQNREFFYAVKSQDGNTMVTTGSKAGSRQYRTIPYNAGAVDIWTETFTGTYTAGQTLRVKITDKTSAQIPYPNWTYEVISTGTIATDLTALAALITAETVDPVATASASGGVLTITGIYNSRQIGVGFSLDTFGVSGNGAIDQSSVAFAQTQVSVSEVGTTADVLEFEKYFKIQNGVMIYTPEGTVPSEFSNMTELVISGVNYGFLVLTDIKQIWNPSSAIPANMASKRYTIVALPTASLAALAAY